MIVCISIIESQWCHHKYLTL